MGGIVDFDVGTGGVGGRGVEEGHALVCAGCDLVVHKVIVQGKIDGGNARNTWMAPLWVREVTVLPSSE